METETLPKSSATQEDVCCPPFDPTLWDEKLIMWDKKQFIKDKVKTFFYMPVNFGSVMKRIVTLVSGQGAEMPDWLCLSDHTSKWNMDVYLAVNKRVEGAHNFELSGTFYCKVYEGPFKDTGKWGEDYNKTVAEKGMKIKKCYMWYTTCPKCAKAYGKNYTVFIAEVA